MFLGFFVGTIASFCFFVSTIASLGFFVGTIASLGFFVGGVLPLDFFISGAVPLGFFVGGALQNSESTVPLKQTVVIIQSLARLTLAYALDESKISQPASPPLNIPTKVWFPLSYRGPPGSLQHVFTPAQPAHKFELVTSSTTSLSFSLHSSLVIHPNMICYSVSGIGIPKPVPNFFTFSELI